VWALAVSQDEKTVVTAAADSVVTFWADSTEIEQREKDEEREEYVAKCVRFIQNATGSKLNLFQRAKSCELCRPSGLQKRHLSGPVNGAPPSTLQSFQRGFFD
jgi:hypothetical protein